MATAKSSKKTTTSKAKTPKKTTTKKSAKNPHKGSTMDSFLKEEGIKVSSTPTSSQEPKVEVSIPNPYNDQPEEPIKPELLSFIAEKLRQPVDKIQPKTNFRKDLGADSLDLVEMVVFMEEKFNLQVSDEDLRFLSTPLAVQNYLKSKGVAP